MTKEMSIIVLGVWVAVVPYLGIPGAWRMLILVLTGIAIAVIGFLLRGESLSHNRGSAQHTFIENLPAAHVDDSSPSPSYIQHEPKEGITSLN